VSLALQHINRKDPLHPDLSQVAQVSEKLCAAVHHLLVHCSYLGGDLSHEVVYEHEQSQRNLRVLDKVILALQQEDAKKALKILTDRETGLPNAYFGQNISYPTYYHYTIGALNPKRLNLFWGKDRALEHADCWIVIQLLKDKLSRGITCFEEELFLLLKLYNAVIEELKQQFSRIAIVAESAADMLPVEMLQGLTRRD